MGKLGRTLKDGRTRLRLTQAAAARVAGISRSEWSELERGKVVATFAIVNRAAHAVGGNVEAYIRETSAADQPRDAVHLRNQELIIRRSEPGGWTPLPEELIDREARTSRAADVLLTRRHPADGVDEYAIFDVRDWLDDVGAMVRDFARRLDALDRFATARMRGPDAPLPRTGGCCVLRATQRNRRLVAEHRYFFRARFPGSGRTWLAALTTEVATSKIPKQPALLWVTVNGERLFPARLG
jgi:transcriptional regulator with XRE-family HTH domain